MNAVTIYKLWAQAISTGLGSHVKLFAKLIIEEAAKAPIDMILHCPECHTQHIDAPGADVDAKGVCYDHHWDNPPHRSHLCHNCGCIWRPADVPTNGVAAIKTKGQADRPAPKPDEPDLIDGLLFNERNRPS